MSVVFGCALVQRHNRYLVWLSYDLLPKKKLYKAHDIQKLKALTFVSRSAIGLPLALRAIELKYTLMGLRMQLERNFTFKCFATFIALILSGLRTTMLIGDMFLQSTAWTQRKRASNIIHGCLWKAQCLKGSSAVTAYVPKKGAHDLNQHIH